MIHLLALRPYKKPELLARLMKGTAVRISKVPCVFIIPTINLGGGVGWGGIQELPGLCVHFFSRKLSSEPQNLL